MAHKMGIHLHYYFLFAAFKYHRKWESTDNIISSYIIHISQRMGIHLYFLLPAFVYQRKRESSCNFPQHSNNTENENPPISFSSPSIRISQKTGILLLLNPLPTSFQYHRKRGRIHNHMLTFSFTLNLYGA